MKDSEKKVLVGVVVAALIIFGILVSRRSSQKLVPPIGPPEVEKVTENSGSFTLESESQPALSKPYEFSVNADSQGRQVVGYDVILKYDPTAFEYVSAESGLGDFQIFVAQRDGYIIVTGTKKLDAASPSVFTNDDKLVSFTFTPKQKGEFSFELMESTGQAERSQMVDEKTVVMYPTVAEMTIEVE